MLVRLLYPPCDGGRLPIPHPHLYTDTVTVNPALEGQRTTCRVGPAYGAGVEEACRPAPAPVRHTEPDRGR